MELVIDDPNVGEVTVCPGGVRLSEVAADEPDVIFFPVVRLQPHNETAYRLRALFLTDEYDQPVLVADHNNVVMVLFGRGLVDVEELHTGQIYFVQILVYFVHDDVLNHAWSDPAQLNGPIHGVTEQRKELPLASSCIIRVAWPIGRVFADTRRRSHT